MSRQCEGKKDPVQTVKGRRAGGAQALGKPQLLSYVGVFISWKTLTTYDTCTRGILCPSNQRQQEAATVLPLAATVTTPKRQKTLVTSPCSGVSLPGTNRR